MSNYLQTKIAQHASLLILTKLLVNEEISVDDYRDALKILCEEYRKEFKSGY